MRMFIALLTACSLPHVPPEPRSLVEENLAAVRVDVDCSGSDPLDSDGEDYLEPHMFPPRTGTGVIISERHVLTAAHLVGCPSIPNVRVTLRDGRHFRAWVERDDVMFGDGADIARLVLATRDTFGLKIAPPALTTPQQDSTVCAAIIRPYPLPCGSIGIDRTISYGMRTQHGDSGAGVYSGAYLVGLVSKGASDGSYTRFAPLSAYWLEGM